MSSWYANLLTTTSSGITNIKRTLLASETDGDTEDDTHVCRVLRAYYTEKGRPFPGWLPPDPKAPPPVQPVYAQQNQVGARYGGLTANPNNSTPSGGSLSSLWDNNAGAQRQDQQSLRQGRGMPPPMRGADPVQSSRNPFARNSNPSEEIQARPLPSQRAGSYQQTTMNTYGRNNSTDSAPQPPGSSASTGSAQDRLRQRLWGARTTSPSPTAPFQPPPQQAPSSSRYGGGGSGGSGDYEEQFAPGGRYDNTRGSGGGGSGGSSSRPFMAANSPWASNEAEYMGGSDGSAGRVGGLPSGPRRGLPSGPRMR